MNKGKRLIEAGYFPKELPVEFTTVELARHHGALKPHLDAKQWTSAETYNLSRNENSRRVLSIVNPNCFLQQADAIDQNWKTIRDLCKASKLSLSPPRFRTNSRAEESGRATNLAPTQKLYDKNLESLSSHRFVMQTDFARFFSSIYTHAIPWSIHSKPVAKAKPNDFSLVGNLLDRATRNGQMGQTTGIPVGPDTSHIFSELIASQIDIGAFKGRWPAGYRYVDDYFLCFDTEAQASQALTDLARAAQDFSIELNYEKTRIRRVADTKDDVGYNPLRDFDFPDGPLGRKTINRLFDVAIAFSATNENALKYGIRMLAHREIKKDDWGILESQLLRASTLNPNCLDAVAYTLHQQSLAPVPMNRSKLLEYFAGVVRRGLDYHRHSDVTWGLWTFKALGLAVPPMVTRALSDTANSVIVLLALDLREMGLLRGSLDIGAWKSLLVPGALYEEHWLLAYESAYKGWLKPPSSFWSQSALFSEMRAKKVSFYDPARLAKVSLAPSKLRAKQFPDLGLLGAFLTYVG